MVLPDGTGSRGNRPRTGRVALFAVAAVVMIVGFIALGSLSPSDPTATETSTTTSTTIEEIEPPVDPEDFTVAQIATGEPLDWEPVLTADAGHPIELVEQFGTFFLFTTSEPWWTGESEGMTVWESADGTNWTRTGAVIPDEYRVTAVASTRQGLIAAGARPGGESLTVWRSESGSDWTSTEIATEAPSPYQTPVATAIGATSESIVVATDVEVDTDGIVDDHLEEIGIDVDLTDASWETHYGGEDGVELSVYGPLITPAVTLGLDELDLTDQERRWLTSGPEPDGQTSVWVLDDRGQWSPGSIPLDTVTGIVGRNTGGLLALGRGGAGTSAGFTSSDGLVWDATAESPTPSEAVNRESFLVGVADHLRPDLLYSMLGGTWREMEIHEAFDPRVAKWTASAFGGGDHGVAMVVEGMEDPPPSFTSARGATTLTSGEAVTLTLDYENQRFVLDKEGTVHTWDMLPYSAEAPGGLEVDLEEEVIVFTDPHDGERLATFTFEELQRAETRYRSAQVSQMLQTLHHGLVLNTGALDWEIKDLGTVVGDMQRVRLITVGPDRVVAVLDKAVAIDENPSGFEIWSAQLP